MHYSLWSNIDTTISALEKYIEEKGKSLQQQKHEAENNAQTEWCKDYLIENKIHDKEFLKNLQPSSIIDICHNTMKAIYKKDNDISGEKCYCENHDGYRHHHFADVYWDGKAYIAYENTETY